MKPSTPEKVSVEFAQAISAGDLDRAVGFFAEEASFLMADGRIVEGRAAISELLQLLIARRPTMSVEIERMIETPRGAIGSERWSLAFEGDGEKPVEQSGRSTVVFARVAEGWEILMDAPWGLVPTGHPQEIDELAVAAREALSERRRPLDEILADESLIRAGGLFAICAGASAWRQLGLGEPPDERALYVGKAAGKFPSRDLRAHSEHPFLAQSVAAISLRRTFAALLVDDLGLTAIPRRASTGDHQWKLFALEEDGDRRLTDWMRANLQVAVWVSDEQAALEEICVAVREAWLPPMNLMELVTPWSAQLKAARAKLSAEAKARM